jgi:hypothetical protein
VAAAQNGEVVGVNVKAVSATSSPSQTLEQLGRKLYDRRTLFADQVTVSQSGQTEHGRTVTKMGVDHDAQSLELVEVPVDSGHVHIGCDAVDLFAQFLRGPLSRVVEQCLQ